MRARHSQAHSFGEIQDQKCVGSHLADCYQGWWKPESDWCVADRLLGSELHADTHTCDLHADRLVVSDQMFWKSGINNL